MIIWILIALHVIQQYTSAVSFVFLDHNALKLLKYYRINALKCDVTICAELFKVNICQSKLYNEGGNDSKITQ